MPEHPNLAHRGGALHLDRSYNFVDKKPVIDQLRTLIGDDDLKQLSEKSGVSRSTLYNWFMGKTISPRTLTVNAVLAQYGKCLGVVDIEDDQ